MADDELDGIRIRRMAEIRKAAYRSRSHCIIAAVCCAVLAIQLAWWAVTRGNIAYGLIATATAMAAVMLISRARQHHREAIQSALPEPATPPDFSTLGDGSQRYADLENIVD